MSCGRSRRDSSLLAHDCEQRIVSRAVARQTPCLTSGTTFFTSHTTPTMKDMTALMIVIGKLMSFMIALLFHMTAVMPVWHHTARREKEAELVFRGEQYARAITQQMKDAGFRVHLDDRNEKLQGKIRDAQLQKIPYMLVLGGREAEAGTVGVRHRAKGDLGPRPVDQFIADLRAEVDTHAIQ